MPMQQERSLVDASAAAMQAQLGQTDREHEEAVRRKEARIEARYSAVIAPGASALTKLIWCAGSCQHDDPCGGSSKAPSVPEYTGCHCTRTPGLG